jgi:hypothetical protein
LNKKINNSVPLYLSELNQYLGQSAAGEDMCKILAELVREIELRDQCIGIAKKINVTPDSDDAAEHIKSLLQEMGVASRSRTENDVINYLLSPDYLSKLPLSSRKSTDTTNSRESEPAE